MENQKDFVEKCDFIHAHEDIVRNVRAMMPEEEQLYDLSLIHI